MSLSWNEIRLQASNFVEEWKDRASNAKEEADAQDFQTDFLKVFGVTRRQVATFEHRVNMGDQIDLSGGKVQGRRGYIDLFWKGRIMIEMKSPGRDRKKAYDQAKEYAEHLPPKDLPFGILISDFLTFDYYDLEKGGELETFALQELPQKVELFGFLAGYKDVVLEAVSPVDIEAAEHMGELHDALKENGYTGHELEMYLVRLLFCLFADDSGIFDEKKLFFKYINDRTNVDGSDLAMHLGQIFDTLNKPADKRLKNIDETLNKFPYVNGNLFEERLETAAFDSVMRKTLLKCCTLDWSQIKPEIFGAMFQSVKDREKRRELGEHYTSETNILKIIKPLFLDDLWDEYEKIIKLSFALKQQRLLQFHTKLQNLKFLDPACGCGNFLVVTYRELRKLEIEVLSEYLQSQQVIDIELLVRVNVDQFFGIEIVEFPARIAQAALWLMDHLMNMEASKKFGKYIARIPLTASPSIQIANALTVDWETVVPKTGLSYILGNPPFVGASLMTKEQKQDTAVVFDNTNNWGVLDYVCCWYKRAAQFIQGTNIEVGFVSTNSICQGEQVSALWAEIMNKYNIKINFAHQTFKWNNEAKGKAAVYCVIIGFGLSDRVSKKLFQYATVIGDPSEVEAKQINAYLVDAENVFINARSTPICKVPKMVYGNKPTDDGNLFIKANEYEDFVAKEPNAKKYIRKIYGADEYINNKTRYCLWLVGAEPSELKKMPFVMERIERVRQFRLASPKKATRESAKTPALFQEIRQPNKDYIIIPRHSSENRDYIPLGFVASDILVNDAATILPDASIYELGLLTSSMHMAWMRYVCGRIKSDYRYSNTIVYNNFPFPNPTEKQKTAIEKAAQTVLDVRLLYPNSNLADLYNPLTMPKELLKAHQKLDRVVEAAYGKNFTTDADRVTHLFNLYQKMTEGLFTEKPNQAKRRAK